MSILVVIALRSEAAPLISELNLTRLDSPIAMPWVEVYQSPDRELTVAVNGVDPLHGVDAIGTTAAALTTAWAVERFNPKWVVSAGTAGGFAARGGYVGQVVVSQGPIIHHDRRIDLDGYRSYGLGGYPTADLGALAAELGFATGPCSSGDSLDAPDQDLDAMKVHGTIAKDMEAAAVAGVAVRAGKQFTALKVITDIVDGPRSTTEEFLANLSTASAQLGASLPLFLSRLD